MSEWPFNYESGQEKVKLVGRINFKHYGPDGALIEEFDTPNSTTNTGFAQVAGLINGLVTNFFEYIAIGTGTTAAAASQTALVAEATRASADTISRVTTTQTNDTAQWVETFSFVAGSAITESSLQDASTAGTMLARQTFSAINVASGDSLQVTWKVQVA